MVDQQLRIRVKGRLDRDTAEVLGVESEVVGDSFELVVKYVDQAQLTGLLLQLFDLHIAFDRMEVCDIISPTGDLAPPPNAKDADARGKERSSGSPCR